MIHGSPIPGLLGSNQLGEAAGREPGRELPCGVLGYSVAEDVNARTSGLRGRFAAEGEECEGRPGEASCTLAQKGFSCIITRENVVYYTSGAPGWENRVID